MGVHIPVPRSSEDEPHGSFPPGIYSPEAGEALQMFDPANAWVGLYECATSGRTANILPAEEIIPGERKVLRYVLYRNGTAADTTTAEVGRLLALEDLIESRDLRPAIDDKYNRLQPAADLAAFGALLTKKEIYILTGPADKPAGVERIEPANVALSALTAVRSSVQKENRYVGVARLVGLIPMGRAFRAVVVGKDGVPTQLLPRQDGDDLERLLYKLHDVTGAGIMKTVRTALL